MKNHVMPPAEFIAPPKFSRRTRCENGDVHNFHYTPYLPTKKSVYIFNYYLWAERLWKLLWNIQ